MLRERTGEEGRRRAADRNRLSSEPGCEERPRSPLRYTLAQAALEWGERWVGGLCLLAALSPSALRLLGWPLRLGQRRRQPGQCQVLHNGAVSIRSMEDPERQVWEQLRG